MSYLSFMVLLVLPFLSFILHRFLNYRSVFREGPQTKIALKAILGSILFVLISIFVVERKNPDLMVCLLYCILASPLLGHLYFQVFNLSETARRIRLLVTLKKGRKVLEEGQYTPEQLVSIRLKRIGELNQVIYKDGSFYPKRTVLTLAAVTLRAIERFMYPRRRRV